MPKNRRGRGGPAQSRPAPSGTDARAVGQRSFAAGRFEQAISAWQSLSDDPQVRVALAEARFRQALATNDPKARADELRLALASSPNDPRLHYHLGLALHRQGDLKAAQEHYAIAASGSTRLPGLARVRALAAIEQGKAGDLDSVPNLSATDRQALAPTIDLLAERTPADSGDAANSFWQSLALLRGGDAAEAVSTLKSDTLPKLAPIRRYYLGLAQALTGESVAALDSLQRAYNQQVDTPWLRENIAAVQYESLQAQLESKNLQAAAEIAQNAATMSSNTALSELQVQVLDQAAQDAASQGDWAQASTRWEAARGILSANAGLGSPRPLLHNLALAYEAQERWLDAAEAWRAMLRTRPRKTAQAAKGEERKTKKAVRRPTLHLLNKSRRLGWATSNGVGCASG